MDYAQFRQATQGADLPLAWLDLDALEQNMQAILDRAGSKPVRVVTKSVRCVSLLHRILNYSPQFQGLMCFHPAEAVFLSEQGLDNLLVAYPSVQPFAIARICELSAQGKNIVLMVDDVAQLDFISGHARAFEVVQPVCIDLDMSLSLPKLYFGVRRSPVRTPAQAVMLYQAIQARSNVQLVGLMGYEAQIAGVGDCVPGKSLQNKIVPGLKRWAIPRLTRRRCATVDALRQAGAQLQFVNGGGSGSIPSTVADPGVTEVAVGSAFFSPHLFDYYRDFRYQPASGFTLEVVRKPNVDYVTCAGGGYIASGSFGLEKLPKPYLPTGLILDQNEGAGEVQTPLLGKVSSLGIGDPVLFRHAKAGELCERFNHLHLIRNAVCEEIVTTYRGDGKAFL